MQRQVIDNLIQENNVASSEQRSKQFTINLVENDDEIIDLEGNGTRIEHSPKQVTEYQGSNATQWIMSKFKIIIVIVLVVFVFGFIILYLYKRKQKKTQEEIAALKQKITNNQFKQFENRKDDQSSSNTGNAEKSEVQLVPITKQQMEIKAAEISKQLMKEDNSDDDVTATGINPLTSLSESDDTCQITIQDVPLCQSQSSNEAINHLRQHSASSNNYGVSKQLQNCIDSNNGRSQDVKTELIKKASSKIHEQDSLLIIPEESNESGEHTDHVVVNEDLRQPYQTKEEQETGNELEIESENSIEF